MALDVCKKCGQVGLFDTGAEICTQCEQKQDLNANEQKARSLLTTYGVTQKDQVEVISLIRNS